jgi:signal transduction histidine kinase
VARGNYDFRIKLATNDEVAELGESLNAMTVNFQEIKRDLNRQVKQRTKEVVRSEKMASVGFLAAGVAHEINNPLAAIAWSAESLESRIYDILNPATPQSPQEREQEIEDMTKYLTRIQEEAFRCNGITSRLLDFSRMGDCEKVPTNLYEVIESVLGIVRPLSKYRDRTIQFEGDPRIRALVNAQEIKQVALNLITYALGCVAPGGKVRIELKEEQDAAVLKVIDDGCGMTDEVMQHLFEPFFTRRRDEQGTGLGLSITYQIIQDHGGRITPNSKGPGCGSTFIVSLPLVKNEQHEIARAA